MLRLFALLLLLPLAGVGAQTSYDAPTEFFRTTFLSNHTRYGPGVCGVTTSCQPTQYYYYTAPIATSSYHCYRNTTVAQYLIDHSMTSVSPSDFPGFSCNLADMSSKCGLTSRFLGDTYTPTSCVCINTCFVGSTCTSPTTTLGPTVVYADRFLNYKLCVQPYLPAGFVYDKTYDLYLPPSTASTADYNTWDVAETQCRLQWFANTPLATSRTTLPTTPTTYSSACPVPCSQFKGPSGGCPAREVCYRRSGLEMRAYASTGVPVLMNGAYVNVPMDYLPMDVCCERGWDGFNCDQPIGCLKTGCDNNGTCLSMGRSNSGVPVQLNGADIRCINCNPGWTGKFCNISAPMWTSPSGTVANTTTPASRRLLQTGFQASCDIVRRDNSFKTVESGFIYPEAGRACDCGVRWSEQAVAANATTVYRILTTGNYNNNFTLIRHRLLSPIRYPSVVSGLFTSEFTPVSSRTVSSKNEARYLCYQDYLCDGFYASADGSTVAFYSGLDTEPLSSVSFVASRIHFIDRLQAPQAYPRSVCPNATLDANFYCANYPLQCASINATNGIGNMYKTTGLTTQQIAELHFRMFGHRVRNQPNPSCSLTTDWLEDVSTCTAPLRCIPGLAALNGTGDARRCGNLTYLEILDPLLGSLERIDTYPSPFTAIVGTANAIAEHGGNGTCSCFAPFRPSNPKAYTDCAIDQCGTGLNQGRVNSSHIALGAGGIQACICLGTWYTDNSTCIGNTCQWCNVSRCSNFGTVSINDTCICSPYFGGPYCTDPVCNNATTTNIVALLASTNTSKLDCQAFCIPPFTGAYCNLTSCIHGVRSYLGGAECICPENYLVAKDGTCAELLCKEGQGQYIGNKTCLCQPQWSGDRCEIDLCAQSIIPGKVGGHAVQSFDDGSWSCSCNWPFALSYPAPTFNQTVNINGLCMSHFCGDWGYPSAANWTRPVDACNCKLNGYGSPFDSYGMGVFTNASYCTGPTFDQCPKPCVQADCGLTQAIQLAGNTFDGYKLEATVTTINGQPYCVCPATYNYTAVNDASRKCKPYLPCVSNGNHTTIIYDSETRTHVCACASPTAAGYYSSSLSTGTCSVFHPTPTPPVVVTPNGTVIAPIIVVPVTTSTSQSDTLLGVNRTLMIFVLTFAGSVAGFAGIAALSEGTVGSAAAAAKAPVSAVATTVININAAGPVTKGTQGRGSRGISKGRGRYNILFLMGLALLPMTWFVTVQAQDVVLGKPGPSYDSLYSPDRRRTEWSKVVQRAIQITADYDDQRNPNLLFASSTSVGFPTFTSVNTVIEVDLSEYEVDTGTLLNAADGNLVKSRPFPTFQLLLTATYPLKPSAGFTGLDRVRVGDQYLDPREVTISMMKFDQGFRLDMCWNQFDQEFRLWSVSQSCPSGYGRTGVSTFAIYAINLCGMNHNCGNGECYNTAGYVYTDVRNGVGLAIPYGSSSLASPVGDLQRSLIYVTIDPVQETLYTTGNMRRPVFGCKCTDGWTGLHCQLKCSGDVATGTSPVSVCNGRGTCTTPLKTMYVGGTLKTCQCDQCRCDNGYAGAECEFALRTRNFATVYDYRVCCFKSFGEAFGKDCAPRYNPMNFPNNKCTPTWAPGSLQYSTSDTPITNADMCAEIQFSEPMRNHPYYSDFLQPADVCGEVIRGRCYQDQLTTRSTKTGCWCNNPASTTIEGVGLLPLRGYWGPTCAIRTCTSKSFLWPPYATQLTVRQAADQTNLATRCSGNFDFGRNNAEDDSDTICDDAFRVSRTTADGTIFTYGPGLISDAASNALWRYNTPGDCNACIPGWGMLPIDYRMLKGTDYEDKYVVYDVNGVPNWNGICSERTFHDESGNVCGGYGLPIYGETMHFKLKNPDDLTNQFPRYRSVRSVVGCVCPAGTISLDSGICQRSITALDAEYNATLPFNAVGCTGQGQPLTISGSHTACSCVVDALHAWNGPQCGQWDERMKEFGLNGRACLNGQFNYFAGLNNSAVPIADSSFTFSSDGTTATSNRVATTRMSPDFNFREQVIKYVGRNFANPYLPRAGTFDALLTLKHSPVIKNSVNSADVVGSVRTYALACATAACQPPAYVAFGIQSEDGYELWGTFNDAGYVSRTFPGGYDQLRASFPGMSPFGHYVTYGQAGIMVITTAGVMSDPAPGLNVYDRRNISRIGVLNIPLTKQLNPTLFASTDVTSNQMGLKLQNQGRSNPCPGQICLPTGISLGITADDGSTAWGEFDSQGYIDLYKLPYDSGDLTFATAWNHFLFNGPSVTRRFPVFTDRMPDPIDGRAMGQLDHAQTLFKNTNFFYRYIFKQYSGEPLPNTLDRLPELANGLPPPVMLYVKLSNGATAYGQFDVAAYVALYPVRLEVVSGNLQPSTATPWHYWLSYHASDPSIVTPVILRQEVRMMGEEIAGQSYNQFTCSCTDISLKKGGRVNQDGKCLIGCKSSSLDPGGSGSPCSGKGQCMRLPKSWDYGCLCNTVPGIGGLACNVTVLRDTNGALCGGADRGNISMPTAIGEKQRCLCRGDLLYAVRYNNASCVEGSRDGDCAFTGLCVSGDPLCTQTGANMCTRPGIQGACNQNPVQGDYYCFCRPGAFEGQACDKATTPALRTSTGTLLSCSGRGTPDPTGTGFCLCNPPYVGYACEIDPTNRPCTFGDGSQGQSYVDGESNGLKLVFQ